MIAKRKGVGGGMEWRLGLADVSFFNIGWINNKVLLYKGLYSISYDKP